MASGLTRGQLTVLASACAVAVSAVYGGQPVLEVAGADLGFTDGALGWLVAAGQLGYLIGLVLLVPLGDLHDRRRLITTHLLLIAVGTATAAVAPSGAVAIAGLAVAGLFATVVQTTVAYVAAVSPVGERGRNIGIVTSGVVIGILGVRVIAGLLGELTDWRMIYLVIAGSCVVLAFAARRGLDPDVRATRARYGRAVSEMGRLFVTDPLLRSRGVIAFFLFASFGTLWSGLAPVLAAAPWHFGTTVIGLFGLAGLTGALGAARAGRWSDKGRAPSITTWSLALLAGSWLLIGHAESSLWPLIVGIVVLDFAVQAVHVSSQHLLTVAHPGRSSGVIGVYMACYSLGSALGAVTTTLVYTAAGWPATGLLGGAYAVLGLLVAVLTRRSTRPDAHADRADIRPQPVADIGCRT
ncbi:putative MFS family arabinose efflux permease [Stackebrandtia albiflava]|uniref:Putative MFS family arabinose efflux permease n=1 Tax=Stackebrandtia albiflava TaxID=406432 RepID=A0A562URB6_9ACTN|nr:MFS transporter [Stackebrandtia albiflava]TWJ08160.1 putative MFS family arabinose efflux permease [Stackebrandtia albiflava]